jgi:hypothetical protein
MNSIINGLHVSRHDTDAENTFVLHSCTYENQQPKNFQKSSNRTYKITTLSSSSISVGLGVILGQEDLLSSGSVQLLQMYYLMTPRRIHYCLGAGQSLYLGTEGLKLGRCHVHLQQEVENSRFEVFSSVDEKSTPSNKDTEVSTHRNVLYFPVRAHELLDDLDVAGRSGDVLLGSVRGGVRLGSGGGLGPRDGRGLDLHHLGRTAVADQLEAPGELKLSLGVPTLEG